MNAHDIAQYAMQKLQETGAQQYACQAHTSAKREFNVDGGKFSLLRTTIDNQLDLTLIKDQKRGKILINAFNQEAVDEAVRDCLAAAEGSAADPAWELVPGAQRKFILGAPDGDWSLDVFDARLHTRWLSDADLDRIYRNGADEAARRQIPQWR